MFASFLFYDKSNFPFEFYCLKVCPTFGVEMIKRVLDNFVPDDFNPTPIPQAVFDALDSEVGPFPGST